MKNIKNVLSISSLLIISISIIAIIINKEFNILVYGNINDNNSIELSSQQKMDDVRYFYDFIRKSYPFAESIESEKGLPIIYKYEKEYIKRAGETKSNKEFVILVAELIQRLEQGTGHSDIMVGQDLPPDFDISKACLENGISKKSIELNKYWWNLLDIDSKYSYSDLDISYKDGEYVLAKDFKDDNISIQRGTKIVKIDGKNPIDYMKLLQNKIWLRFDPILKIPYSFHPSPFVTYGDKTKSSWNVEFQDLDGHTYSYLILKKQGYRAVRNYPMYNKNVLCMELNKNTAYVRIFAFPDYLNAKSDVEEMKMFFSESKKKYEKLIIDLRMNAGGSPKYGEELLIKPFIKKPSNYIQYAAVKKDIYNKLNQQTKLIDSLEINSVKQWDFGNIEKIKFEELTEPIKIKNKKNNSYYYFKTTKLYKPSNSVQFDGNIFLLIDNDCFSAAEDIIRVFRELKIGKIIGTNSLGGAAVVLPPWIFELPNSHILFTLEVELAYNADGTIDEIYGTKPDIEFEPSTYPTYFPESFLKEDLLKDKLINRILNNGGLD